ncbi:MAG: DUF1622 domain-containing protein [Candidatus Riflebacteria bacterium]|nr:DUF1622 domain-containing protein [Candidatus Riflebacteria bacterium]
MEKWFFETVGFLISLFGTVVVFWGVAEAFLGFLRTKLKLAGEEATEALAAIRRRLGAHLLLGLEVFIAEDIINSVIRPSWEKVGMLGAIVVIRTVLSHFLHRELAEEEHGKTVRSVDADKPWPAGTSVGKGE